LPEYFRVLDIGVVRGRLLDRRHTPVRTAIVVVLALIVVEGAVGISHAKAAKRQALSDDGAGAIVLTGAGLFDAWPLRFIEVFFMRFEAAFLADVFFFAPFFNAQAAWMSQLRKSSSAASQRRSCSPTFVVRGWASHAELAPNLRRFVRETDEGTRVGSPRTPTLRQERGARHSAARLLRFGGREEP